MINNKNQAIAVFGSALVSNHFLMDSLNNNFQVISYQKIDQFVNNYHNIKVSVFLFEIDESDAELKPLSKVIERYSNIPVIALGEGRQQELIAQAFQLGICDFFKAPYKVDLLVEKIKSLTMI